ncbi:glycosyltransferase family 4 protein [Hyunsoonleella ulvae]|uniref:glycosyltransferase family 4 protein n=1 Tax=Hyunsoonleella ulvae TaxID=2799948 RepID=UPI001939A2EC|nr:glycosyltransferase family 4 protein [Hyunsoonleella ulvae]
MKVVFIIDQVYKHGGIERILSVKANYLASLNYEVTIITTQQRNKNRCYNFHNKIVFVDVGAQYQEGLSYFHPKNLIKLPKHIIKLSRLLSQIKPNVVTICSHSTDTYFVPFINKSIPKIKEFHFSKSIESYSREHTKSLFKKYFYRFSDYVESKYERIVILNKDELNYYKSLNTVVIPNPSTFSSKKSAALKNKIAVTVGRIAPVKGFDILMDIWSEVAKIHNDWKLYVYGNGDESYLKYLKEKINELNLNHIVILKGNTNNVEAALLSSSFFVMTSLNECFPLVLLEAQACGLPIISFDCPHGPRNIITKESGILIPEQNIDTFANSVVELIENKGKRLDMGKAAKKNIKNYNIEVVMAKWIEMFNEVNKE